MAHAFNPNLRNRQMLMCARKISYWKGYIRLILQQNNWRAGSSVPEWHGLCKVISWFGELYFLCILDERAVCVLVRLVSL